MRADVERLLATGEAGGLLTELPRVQLCGRPNAGKSSLFNALIQRDRALVTDVPGTTRDLIEAAVHLDGVEVLLSDSAGITDDVDEIGAEAVGRARRSAESADLLLLVVDATKPLDAVAPEASALFESRRSGQVIVCLNKCDLPAACREADMRDLCEEVGAAPGDELTVVHDRGCGPRAEARRRGRRAGGH